MAAEDIMICIDNCRWMEVHPECLSAQCLAIELYCKTKFKCNPQNRVGLFRMGSDGYGLLFPPTSDLKRILSVVGGILLYVFCDGVTRFHSALVDAAWCLEHFKSSPNTKKRILGLVGSSIPFYARDIEPLGSMLKEISLDVVVFFPVRRSGFGSYDPRKKLRKLVKAANDSASAKHQMVVVDVVHVEADVSFVWERLANSVLKMDILDLSKKNVKENVKQEKGTLPPGENEKSASASASAENQIVDEDEDEDEDVEERVDESLFCDLISNSISKINNSSKKEQEKEEENVKNVKQEELEPSCNENINLSTTHQEKEEEDNVNNVKQEELKPYCSNEKNIKAAAAEKGTLAVIDLKPGENEKVKMEAA